MPGVAYKVGTTLKENDLLPGRGKSFPLKAVPVVMKQTILCLCNFIIQSTLVISNSKGLTETLRDIRT